MPPLPTITEYLNMRRISIALAAVLLVGLLVGACGSMPTAVPTEAFTGLTFTDALGRTVVFDTPLTFPC
jgi:hypothetical protein